MQIRGLIRSSRAVSLDALNVRFNGDTGSNYSIHELTGGGSSAAAQAQTSVSSLYGANTVPSAASLASGFEPFVMDILDYSSTAKYKTTRSLNGSDFNGSGNISLTSGLWMNTAAITSIELFAATGTTFITGSTFTLYGIKAA